MIFGAAQPVVHSSWNQCETPIKHDHQMCQQSNYWVDGLSYHNEDSKGKERGLN